MTFHLKSKWRMIWLENFRGGRANASMKGGCYLDPLERGGQLQPVLASAAAPCELQYVVDLPPAVVPRYPH
ncbi:hypothetical protein ACFX2J_006149 [Malus domestica]